MTRKFFCIAVIGLLTAAATTDEKGIEIEKLKGSWACISATVNGKALSDETVKKLRLTLSETGYKTQKGDDALFDSTYTIDITQQPKWIDIIGTEGEAKGKAARGIYALENGKLRICYTMPGGKRPTAFESAPDSGASLAVWQRAP